VWPWLVARQPLVLHLTRENLIRQAVSLLLNKQARSDGPKRPQHSFREVQPVKAALAPALVLQSARNLQAADRRAQKMIAGRMKAWLPLTYAQVVGGEAESAEWMPPRTTTRVCEFLGVRRERMRCDLKRVNPYPLRDLLSNWKAVEAAVRGSEFKGCLAEEEFWADG
jgi:hypothetical protein